MHRVLVLHLFALVASTVFLCSDAYLVDSNPYRHVETLDPDGKYVLEWMVDWPSKQIIFNVTAETTGYVGFGLSRRGKMSGADIVMGGVAPGGKPYLTDRHAIGNQLPVVDEHQDWTLLGAWESVSHTFLSFSRALDTCDKEDFPITEDIISIIWSLGENDNLFEYHFHNRGSYDIYLLDPDLTPRIAEPKYRAQNPAELGELKIWTINKLELLPAKETFYTCSFHKAPRFPKKHHIVGFNTILHSEVEEKIIHHFFLYRCHAPVGRDAAAFFERYVRNRGEECYTHSSRADKIPTLNCREPVHIWSAGGKPVFLPDHVGYPLSESPNEYYMIQAHYENPEKAEGIRLRYTLEMFYTGNVRKHDAGAMIIGQKVPASPSIVIPPSSLGHVVYGHCGEGCTKQMFPSEGIQIVAASLHTFAAGRGARLLQIRGNEEQPYISVDDNYNPIIQRTRILKKERTVLPGDLLITRCAYQTAGNGPITTVGGVSLKSETCLAVVWYYNKLPGYGECTSEIRDELYHSRLGISNLTWSDEHLEMVVTSPPIYAGLTVSELTTDNIKWTIGRRTQLQDDHRFLPQITQCPIVIPGLEPTEAPAKPDYSYDPSPSLSRYRSKAGVRKIPVVEEDPPVVSEYESEYSKDVVNYERTQVCVRQTKEVVHVNEKYETYEAPAPAGQYPTNSGGQYWTINSKAQGYRKNFP